eukprot:1691962-Prymnesium_polylepis.2
MAQPSSAWPCRPSRCGALTLSNCGGGGAHGTSACARALGAASDAHMRAAPPDAQDLWFAGAGNTSVRVVGLLEWASSAAMVEAGGANSSQVMRVKEAVFHTEGSLAIKYVWGRLLPCTRAGSIRAFQAQVF